MNTSTVHMPTKIVYVADGIWHGGVEGQLLELVRHLDRKRFDPTLVLFDAANSRRAEGAIERVFTLGADVSDTEQTILARVRRAALRIHSLTQLLRRLRPAVLHSFLLSGSSITGSLAGGLARVPIVIGSRRSSPTQYRHSFATTFSERAALRLTNFMIGNSLAVTRELTEWDGYEPWRASTIYNGVDCERFQPKNPSDARRRFGWDHRHVVLGTVANFRSCKRHVDLVRAFQLLQAKYPQLRLLMAGLDCGTLDVVRQAIHDAGVEEFCRIVTGDSNPERDVYPSIDIYVCTSESEGFSNVLLEAMACGKPVIATDVGGNAEAIRNEQDGFIIPPFAPEAVVQAAEPLIEDIHLRRRLGESGRKRVLQTFSIPVMVRAYEDRYAALLEKTS